MKHWCATCNGSDGGWEILDELWKRAYDRARPTDAPFPPYSDWLRMQWLNHDPVFATRALQQAGVLAHVDERFIEWTSSSLPSFVVTLSDYKAWKAKTNVSQDSQVP